MNSPHHSLSGRSRFIRAACGLCLALVMLHAGGCSAYRDPAITITGARLGEATDEAIRMDFGVDLSNPNTEPLKLLEFNYTLSVNGVRVYQGMRAARATLAANGQRQMEIPAVVRYDAIGWTSVNRPDQVKYAIDGTLRYVTPGEIAQILLDTGVRRPQASFHQTGQAQLK